MGNNRRLHFGKPAAVKLHALSLYNVLQRRNAFNYTKRYFYPDNNSVTNHEPHNPKHKYRDTFINEYRNIYPGRFGYINRNTDFYLYPYKNIYISGYIYIYENCNANNDEYAVFNFHAHKYKYARSIPDTYIYRVSAYAYKYADGYGNTDKYGNHNTDIYAEPEFYSRSNSDGNRYSDKYARKYGYIHAYSYGNADLYIHRFTDAG